MAAKEPSSARGFTDCNDDLHCYRTEQWLAGLARKTWLYLTRLETLELATSDDDAWTAHELAQARCRLKTIEWLRTVNISKKG